MATAAVHGAPARRRRSRRCGAVRVAPSSHGNELIVKGALEAGVSLLTGYPGRRWPRSSRSARRTPRYLPASSGVEAVLANNEAQSARC